MAEPRPETPSQQVSGSNRPSDPPPSAAANFRRPQRQSSRQDLSESPRPRLSERRRSSLISLSSVEDATQAWAQDIISPSTSKSKQRGEDNEVTHWHSTPLAFAILPAVGGVLFKNGSAFVTDVLLLGLAAIFMNWSIRLPWDWYYSAQAQRVAHQSDESLSCPEPESSEAVVEPVSSTEGSQKHNLSDSAVADDDENQMDSNQEDAAVELQRQEILAFLATFIFPVLAAYLLHVIRGQLSNSSTSLVSDYNLCIFILAAEVRPCRQLARLVTNRTLHLQRTVTGLDDPFGAAAEEKTVMGDLTSRITELESKLSGQQVVSENVKIAQKADVSDLSLEMRKRYDSRLDGLERAVRRYEKRTATLAMLTDQRIAQLETRLQDALSLAAVAAQRSNRGPMTKITDGAAVLIMWPMQIAWEVAASPFRVVDDIYTKIQGMLLGSAVPRTAKRKGPRSPVTKNGRPRTDGPSRRVTK